MTAHQDDTISTLEVFLTAEEAFPAFERLFLAAEKTIHASFRIFDLNTRLRSPEALRIGATWFDLFAHVLARGVDVTLIVADFDPIVATKLHRKSWKSAQQLAAVQAVAEGGRLAFRIARHPARVGIIPRTLFRRKVRERYLERQKDRYTPGLAKLNEDDVFELAPVTHHQKLAVFDRKTLYIGGLDLDERRYDTKDHAREAQETWQDVQVVATGPVVGAAIEHLESFEDVVARRRSPAPPVPGFVRTLSTARWPAPFRISPRTIVKEIEAAHLAALTSARSLIYLETQFLRHLPLAEALAAAGAVQPDLRLIVVLPAAPEDIAFDGNDGHDARLGEALQANAIARIRDGFGDRALICSPARRVAAEDTDGRDTLKGSPIVYVHSKVSIFDDSEAIVSSANLNGRSLRWDTEAGLHLSSVEQVRYLRNRIFGHWMPGSGTDSASTLTEVWENWRSRIAADAVRAPETRTSRLLPYDPRPAEEIGETVPLVPREMV